MGQSEDRFRAAAAECVEAAAKCSDADADAAATLLLMAQRWLDLAHEHDKPKNYLAFPVEGFNGREMGNGGN